MTNPKQTPNLPRAPLNLRLERAWHRVMFLACRTMVRLIPFAWIRPVGEWIGEAHFCMDRVARQRMVRELAIVAGRPPADPTIREQMRSAYRSNDAAVLEMLKMLDRQQDEAMLVTRVEVEGTHELSSALAAGRGAILLAGHAGNSALLVVQLVSAGFPVSVVYREAKMMDSGLVQRGLSYYGVEGILATDGIKAYGRMLQALRRGSVVYIMVDQGTKKARDGVVVRFLGKDMPMSLGPAQLARHANSPVLPVATVGARPKWRFRIYPPLPRRTGSSLANDAEYMLKISEQLILSNAQWWSWHQRRWRSYPLAVDLLQSSDSTLP